MFNAIEHGNLEIGFDKKRECLVGNSYNQEVVSRLTDERYQNRSVKVEIENSLNDIFINIIGGGPGFDWKQYMVPDANVNLNMPNGRGIAIAKKLLGEIHYNSKGTEVSCRIDVASPAKAEG